MFRKLLFAATVLASAGAARAADAPGLSVTIYNANLALVQDVRQLDIARGRQRLEFKDVSAQIRPETVTLGAEGIGIVEQNFDYDLLTPSKLMEKAVGQQVRIVRTNPGNGQEVTETATVLAANQGVVLKIGDRIEVLRDDGVPTRVIFDKVPDNLRAHPTLSVTVDSDHAGARPATLSYLTTGLAWKADYVALFDEGAGKLDLQGWITLINNSGVSYQNASTQLVAGDVQIGGNPRAPYGYPNRVVAGVRQAGTERHTGPGEALGDYYIYTLPERTTIAQNQTKQVSFLDAHGVTAHKVYQWGSWAFESNDNPTSASVVVDFQNATAGGLGAGLPAGTIRVYQRDAHGEPKFVGENEIGHTPQGSELAVKIGDAFDVTVQPTLVSADVVSYRRHRFSMSYLVRNARPDPVTVELRQGGLWIENRVIKESLASRKIDAFTRGWSVPVPANGQTVVTFEVETWW
ncbi:MAG TPA: DUF4139 domain-containing protein [Caulobacteraceae bacterium]|nr:DUF4139 domain-containing protein [Caulobacteraceae bacterium]